LRSAWLPRLAIVVLWLVVWQIVAQLLLIVPTNSILVATPYQVAIAFLSFLQGNAGPLDVGRNVVLTIYELLVAFGIAASAGLALGVLVGQFKLLEESLEPLIVALLAVPNFVLFPIMFLLLSLGPRSDVAFGAYLGFFPIIANTIAGTRQVDSQLILLGRSMGASNLEVFGKIILPASMGTIISGLKQGFSLCTIGVVGGEILAPISGIGFLLAEATGFFLTAQLYAMILLTVMIAVFGNIALSGVERLLLRT